MTLLYRHTYRNFIEEPPYQFGAEYAWADFKRVVIYGYASWPSYSYWIVPGTITDEERF